MPIKTFNSSGGVIFDSDTVRGGVCFDRLEYEVGASGSKSYPTMAGAAIVVVDVAGAMQPGVTVTYPSGVPTVTVAATSYFRVLLVWATSAPSVSPSIPGIQALTPTGALALTPEGFGINYIGSPPLYSQRPNSASGTGFGQPIRELGESVFRITSVNPIVAAIEHQPNKCSRLLSVLPIGGNVWEIRAWCCHTSNIDSTGLAEIQTPLVHCFARPAAALENPRCAMFAPDGKLLWDLMRPGLLSYHSAPVFGATDTSKTIDSLPRMASLSHAGLNYQVITGAGIYLGDRIDNIKEYDWFWYAPNSTTLARMPVMFTEYADLEGATWTLGTDPGVKQPLIINLAGL